jgi:hypothetical protein
VDFDDTLCPTHTAGYYEQQPWSVVLSALFFEQLQLLRSRGEVVILTNSSPDTCYAHLLELFPEWSQQLPRLVILFGARHKDTHPFQWKMDALQKWAQETSALSTFHRVCSLGDQFMDHAVVLRWCDQQGFGGLRVCYHTQSYPLFSHIVLQLQGVQQCERWLYEQMHPPRIVCYEVCWNGSFYPETRMFTPEYQEASIRTHTCRATYLDQWVPGAMMQERKWTQELQYGEKLTIAVVEALYESDECDHTPQGDESHGHTPQGDQSQDVEPLAQELEQVQELEQAQALEQLEKVEMYPVASILLSQPIVVGSN